MTLLGHLLKTTEITQKHKETGDARYIYQNELVEARFQHDITHGDFKRFT